MFHILLNNLILYYILVRTLLMYSFLFYEYFLVLLSQLQFMSIAFYLQSSLNLLNLGLQNLSSHQGIQLFVIQNIAGFLYNSNHIKLYNNLYIFCTVPIYKIKLNKLASRCIPHTAG